MELLAPLPIGRHSVAPSRVMFGPHETNLGDGRQFSARHSAYYARRAVGGAGIIVLEEAAVHDSDWAYERSPRASECGPGWAAIMTSIAASVSTNRPVVLAALGHSGGQGTSHWSQRELWAPSAVPEVVTREVPKIMEQRDIDDVVAGFATATRLAVASGVDGVEINAGQFSLVRQFLSGLTNMRTDEYGTDRLRFAREVLSAVRAVDGEAVVALRLSVDELAPWAGIVPEAGAALAVELASYVDLITIVRGSIYSSALTRPDGHVDPGFAIDLARQVRAALRSAGSMTPVVAQGSIVDWGQAEWAITDQAADAVEMTRAQLADASLVTRLRLDQSARIRPCILCNQTCKVRDNRNPIVTCVVDPRTGHELDDPAEPETRTPSKHRKLTVVGGGVAGLEAARVGALAGFQVELHERIARVGGMLRVASVGHGRSRLGLFADWLEAECRALGVDIRTESALSNHDVANLTGEVVVATGSVPSVLPFSIDGGRVIDATELLLDPPGVVATVDGVIVVWDPIGGPVAISVAELIAPLAAAHGGSVTLVTPDLLVGEKLSLSGDLAPSQGRLHGSGVRLVKRAIVRKVTATGVTIEDRFSGEQSTIPSSALIVCAHRVPDTEIDREERKTQIGDRVAPRTVLEAVLEARRAVGSIGAR